MKKDIFTSNQIHGLVAFCLMLLMGSSNAIGEDQATKTKKWIPLKSTDWIRISDNVVKCFNKENKLPFDASIKLAPMMKKSRNNKISGGALLAPMMSVDRTTGALYAFPQSGALFVSHDNGQTFNWLNKEVTNWGFNESPTSIHVSPDGKKMRIFSSNISGYSHDSGKTWKYMNFKIAFGFEDGHINWHGNSQTIIARSHTWPKPRMWLSRDGGASFTEYSKEITKKISSQTMGMMDDDVMLFQVGKSLLRTEDYGKTFETIPLPKHKEPTKSRHNSFIGVTRRFKNKVYWLNNLGVYTSANKGKTWDLIGNHFPDKFLGRTIIRSGPAFGKDENHMVVMTASEFIETMDGGKSWSVLAKAPVHFHLNPWSFSFSYDPVNDIIYCNSRGHGGGPYLFSRLAIKRWGSTEKLAPSNPTDIKATILPTGNKVKISWKPSQDPSGIVWYRIYIDDKLKHYTKESHVIFSNLKWNQKLNISIQAVDAWNNLSKKINHTFTTGDYPKNAINLKDLKWESAKTNIGDLQVLTKLDTTTKKPQPISLMGRLLNTNPVKKYSSTLAHNALALHIQKKHSNGSLTYALDKKYKRLHVDVGLRNGNWLHIGLIIKVDGKVVGEVKGYSYWTAISNFGRPPEPFDIDLTDAQKLTFEIKVKTKRYFTSALIVLNNAMLLK